MSLFNRSTGRHRMERPVATLGALVAGVSMVATSLFAVTVSQAAPAPTATAPQALPVVTQDVSTLSVFDAELLRLTNVKRVAAGLPALQEARGLTNLSKQWSTQMANGATGGKLAHNPTGFEQVLTFGAAQRKHWGENVLKWSPTTVSAQAVFDAYFASATHKANLLNKNYAYLGVSTVTNAAGVSFNTINFTDAADAGQTYDPKAAATPIGHFESATIDGTTARVVGWATDPDAAGTKVTIKDTSPDGTTAVLTATANLPRADVATIYPAYGKDHGFDVTFPIANRGTHKICATAVNAGAGLGNIDLGCLTVEVGLPTGSLDTVQATGKTLTVAGWAIDPDQPNAAANVVVSDKAPNGTVTKTTVAANSTTTARTVAGASAAHGFTATTSLVGSGDHQICATVVAVRSATVTTDLGCKTVTVAPVSPVGALDTVTSTSTTLSVTGWAADPEFPAAAASVKLTVTTPAGTGTTTVPADQVYPTDVAGTGTNHAFSVTAPLTADGATTVCATAISTTDPKVTADLGCKNIVTSFVQGNADKPVAVKDSTGRGVSVSGWAFDASNKTAVSSVKIVVSAESNTSTATVNAELARTDVARAFAEAGANHGYQGTVLVKYAGVYSVCVYGVSLANPANEKLLATCTKVKVS